MYLKHLSLTNFRNYARLERDFPERTVLVQGQNAQGKTNLLEAIYYLATTRSPIIASDRHLISWGVAAEPLPYARLVGDVERSSGAAHLEVTLVREPARPENPAGRLARHIRLNGVERRAIDLLGQLNVVLFLPQDSDLIAGAPALRRRYLDVTLCQVDPAYCRHLQRYNRVLEQRNHLLRRLRERHDDPAQLTYWDEQLARWGALISRRRQRAVSDLEAAATLIHGELTGGSERLALQYEASLALPQLEADPATPEPDQPPPALYEAALSAIARTRQRDLASGVTTVGPHRDELRFVANGVDLGLLGSRGQQRTAALALKLAEVRFMAGQTGDMPILLLDDVMSELDRARGQYLLAALAGARQVVITTTDIEVFPREFVRQTVRWQVREGTISEERS